MDKVRAALIGYGQAGKVFHAPLIRATDGIELTAVVSSNPTRVRADLGDMLVFADPSTLMSSGVADLIVIATPNSTHASLAKAAIYHGLSVVIDKPFATTLEEARELAQCAKLHRVMLSVFHNRRWDSDFIGIRNALESGALGRVTHFESRMERFRPTVRDQWREEASPGAGVWFDLGPHLVDQVLLLFGLPTRVLAVFATQRDGAIVEDWAHAVLDYPERRVVLHTSLLGRGSPRFAVHGTHGSAIKQNADPQGEQLANRMDPRALGWGVDPDPVILIDGDGVRSEQPVSGDQRTFYAQVVKHLIGKGPNPVPGIQALAVHAALEAVARSAERNCWEELDLTDIERASFIESLGGPSIMLRTETRQGKETIPCQAG